LKQNTLFCEAGEGMSTLWRWARIGMRRKLMRKKSAGFFGSDVTVNFTIRPSFIPMSGASYVRIMFGCAEAKTA